MSVNLFHPSLSVVIFRLWICYTPGGDIFSCFIWWYSWSTETNLPKLNTRKSVLDFCFNSWRRFCLVLRIKRRIKEPGIKKDSKGEEGWGKKDNEEGNSRNLSGWVWMIQSHLHSLTLSSTLDFLKKYYISVAVHVSILFR